MRNTTILLITALLLTTSTTFASATRILDGQQITNGAAVLTLPSSTDTILGRATTDTLTNKTLTSPVINTPTGIVKGDVGLGNVDNTSDATKNAATATLTNKTLTAPVINSPTGIVKGDVGLGNVDNTSDATKNAATATLTNKTLDGATNTFTNIPAATALSGQVPVANGGTGASTLTANNVILGNGTSAVQFVAPGTSGNVLTSNGTTWTSAAAASGAPTLTGSRASPSLITAAGGIAFTGTNYYHIWFIAGNAGAVNITADPQIAVGVSVGQVLKLIGRHATNTVTLEDGTGLSLNGAWVGGLDSMITLVWDGTNWVEESRR